MVGSTRREGIARDPGIAESPDASRALLVGQLSSCHQQPMARVHLSVQFIRYDARCSDRRDTSGNDKRSCTTSRQLKPLVSLLDLSYHYCIHQLLHSLGNAGAVRLSGTFVSVTLSLTTCGIQAKVRQGMGRLFPCVARSSQMVAR